MTQRTTYTAGGIPRRPPLRTQTAPLFAAALLLAFLHAVPAAAQVANPVVLSQVPVPEPANLHMFVKDKQAAIRLGKALFWDMQVGSDGTTACASCHFHAGADNRPHNSVSPGLLRQTADLSAADPDVTFQATVGPDRRLAFDDFPFLRLEDPEDRFSTVLRNRNDVTSSQGVPLVAFERVRPGQAVDAGRPVRDDVFHRNLRNVRRVEPLNTPTVINAVFNFANFWDGRANHFFNGVNPLGPLDTSARVLIHNAGVLEELDLNDLRLDATGSATNPYTLDNASLASQAVGPPLSDFEMSWRGRTWPDIGRKMLPLRPLAEQQVHPQDSSLSGVIHESGRGLNTTYGELVRAAFRDEFWNAEQPVAFARTGAERVRATDEDPRTLMRSAGRAVLREGEVQALQAEGESAFTQIEANFSLFFGLAVQLYQATLVADDTPFDRFLLGDPTALTERQLRGLGLFQSGGAGCLNCHIGPELTGASVRFARDPEEGGLIELMAMGDGNRANYDIGFYNIGVRPTREALGRGGAVTLDGRTLPLSFSRQFLLSLTPEGLPFEPIAQPGCVNDFLATPPNICPPPDQIETRVAVDGAVKTPGLRNVELTGPYMHNGGMATLRQVVDFYVRGGDFREANMDNLDPFIRDINGMKDDVEKKEDLVDFLISLTDERVRWERAPFDHPQLFLPDGHLDQLAGDPKRSRALADRMIELPAVGRLGRTPQMGPLKPFLADGLEGDELANFHFRP